MPKLKKVPDSFVNQTIIDNLSYNKAKKLSVSKGFRFIRKNTYLRLKRGDIPKTKRGRKVSVKLKEKAIIRWERIAKIQLLQSPKPTGNRFFISTVSSGIHPSKREAKEALEDNIDSAFGVERENIVIMSKRYARFKFLR